MKVAPYLKLTWWRWLIVLLVLAGIYLLGSVTNWQIHF